MVKARRDYGLPVKALVVGRGSEGFEYDNLGDYTALEDFVDNIRIGFPTRILGWGSENEILNIWSTAETPGPVCWKFMVLDYIPQNILNAAKGLFEFRRFNLSG